MALRVVAWDDVNQRFVRTTKDPADITGGGGPTGGTGGAIPDFVQAGSAAIGSGQTSLAIVFPDGFTNTSYSIQCNFTNTTDANPQFQQPVITVKSAAGFTASWNAPTDSANYRIDYQAVVPCALYRSNVEDVLSSVSSDAAALVYTAAMPFTPGLTNTVDGIIDFQPLMIVSGANFTTSWNVPTASANYDHEWNAIDISCPDRKSNTEALTSGTTSITVNYTFPQLNGTSYTLIPRFENVVDGSPLYQAITVTAKSLGSFTAKWNVALDSNNYKLKWILNEET